MTHPELPAHIPRPADGEAFDDWAQRALSSIAVRSTTDEEGEVLLNRDDLARGLDSIMAVQLSAFLATDGPGLLALLQISPHLTALAHNVVKMLRDETVHLGASECTVPDALPESWTEEQP